MGSVRDILKRWALIDTGWEKRTTSIYGTSTWNSKKAIGTGRGSKMSKRAVEFQHVGTTNKYLWVVNNKKVSRDVR